MKVSRKWFGAWYLCIGVGFILLGLRAYLVGANLFGVILRWVIAGGFLLLGALELRSKK
jgi:hypothetical protein